jgi:hypothetical protein
MIELNWMWIAIWVIIVLFIGVAIGFIMGFASCMSWYDVENEFNGRTRGKDIDDLLGEKRGLSKGVKKAKKSRNKKTNGE